MTTDPKQTDAVPDPRPIAERLYGATPAEPIAGVQGWKVEPPPAGKLDASGIPIPDTITDAPLNEDEDRAERLNPADGSPPPDGSYEPMVSPALDAYLQNLKNAGEEVDAEALAAAKAQILDTMSGFGLGAPGAKEVAHVFARYSAEPMSDDAVAEANTRSIAQLREAWGPRFDSNLRHARNAFNAACERLPWLFQESMNGAGSDVGTIKVFASIGRRLARRAGK